MRGNRNKKKHYLLIIIYLIFIALLTKNHVTSSNNGSRFATIQSLVEKGTFIIDNSSFRGKSIRQITEVKDGHLQVNGIEVVGNIVDRIHVNGHDYSDKPPVYPFLSSGIYWILFHLGISFDSHPGLSIYLLTLFSTGIFAVLLLFFFYKLTRKFFSEKQSLILTGCLGFCTLIFSYSITYNNYTITAFLLILTFYLLLNLRDSRKQDNRIIFLCGLLSALSATIDNVTGGIFLIVFLIYTYRVLHIKRKYIFFILGAAIPLILHVILNVPITGDILPGSLHPDYWTHLKFKNNKISISGSHPQASLTNALIYAFNSLFGSRGMFLYTPLFILSVIGIIILIKQKKRLIFETYLICSGIVAIILYYIIMTTSYGGEAYGMRYFISFAPFLVFYIGFYLETGFHKRHKHIFSIAAILSLIFSIIGLYQPWSNMSLTGVPFINNLIYIWERYFKRFIARLPWILHIFWH